MKAAAALAILFLLAQVKVTPERFTITPGQTIVITGYGVLGCCTPFPWGTVEFKTYDPLVATATGSFTYPDIRCSIYVTGVSPGTTSIVSPWISNGTWPLAEVDVVAPPPPPPPPGRRRAARK